jgi:hypothetical protein
MNINDERTFFLNLSSPNVKKRIIGMLEKPEKRKKFRALLPHSTIFDSRWVCNIPKNKQCPDGIYRMLRDKNAPDDCHMISSCGEIEGVDMPLREALERVVGQLLGGTVIICIAESLGYFEGEEYGDRYILCRNV